MSSPPPPMEYEGPIVQKDEAIAPALGNIAVSGFKWTLAFTAVTRVLSFASSIVLARLLLRSDYGAYAEAFITISIISALRDSALAPVLVARPRDFERLQSDGFWLSLGLGVASAGAIAAVGCYWWSRPGGHLVAKLLWLNALASPLMTLGTISVAKTQIQLRFKLTAKIATVNYLATTSLSILLASPLFKWGPYALMVPQVLAGAVRGIYYCWLEPPQVRRRIDRSTIWMLLAACAMLAYSGFASQIVGQGDNFVITRHFSADAVGLYSWAFNLSGQAILLLAASLWGVVLPTLSMLGDEPARQIAAFLRMSRTLAAIGVPCCCLQMIFARPIVQPLFSREWAGAEPLIAILSLSMAFQMVNGFGPQLLMARKQLRLLVIIATASAISFMICVYAGVWLGGVMGVAWGVVAFQSIVGTAGMRVAVGRWAGWRDILEIFWPPLLAAAIAALPALSMALLFPRTYRGEANLPITLVLITVFALVFVGFYTGIIRILAPETYREILHRIDAVTQRFGLRLVRDSGTN